MNVRIGAGQRGDLRRDVVDRGVPRPRRRRLQLIVAPQILGHGFETVAFARQFQREIFPVARTVLGDFGNASDENRLAPLQRSAGDSAVAGSRRAARFQPPHVFAIVQRVFAIQADAADHAAAHIGIEGLRLHAQYRERLGAAHKVGMLKICRWRRGGCLHRSVLPGGFCSRYALPGAGHMYRGRVPCDNPAAGVVPRGGARVNVATRHALDGSRHLAADIADIPAETIP